MSALVSVETIRSKVLELLLQYERDNDAYEIDELIVRQYVNEIIKEAQIVQLIVRYYNVEGFRNSTAQTNALMAEWKGKSVDLLHHLYTKYTINCEVKLKPISFKSMYCSLPGHKCKNKLDNIKYGVKVIRTQNIDLNKWEHTIDIWREISNPPHPNIVSLRDVFTSDSKTLLVTDLCTNRSLYKHRKDKTLAMDENKMKLWFKDIICAIQHLHHKQIAHGNISIKSIVFEDKSSSSKLKLSSFQDARRTTDTTPDLYSAGELLHQLLTGYDVSDTKSSWGSVSNEGKDLVATLLEKDPSKRLTTAQTLQHAWFRDINALSVSLDDVQIEFTQQIGHRPHTQSQLLQFCKHNDLPFYFRNINEWWPTRPDPEAKPQIIPINADEMQLMQSQIERKQSEEVMYQLQQMIMDVPITNTNETIAVQETRESIDDHSQSDHPNGVEPTPPMSPVLSVHAVEPIHRESEADIPKNAKKLSYWHCCKCMCCARSAQDTDYTTLTQHEDARLYSHSHSVINVVVIADDAQRKGDEGQPLIISSPNVNYT